MTACMLGYAAYQIALHAAWPYHTVWTNAMTEGMNTSPTPHEHNHSEPPLWSIGLTMLVIVCAPIILYSFAPTGPLREGDTVFSDGQQHARITQPVSGKWNPADDTCLLDPDSPLIILHAPHDHVDGVFLAEVQGNPSGDWPFCPVHTEVQIGTHQVFQKPAAFDFVREAIMRLFGQ